ncbi:cysteine hydrolase family protein [Flavobacterium aquidurense]|uniref:cysteine hydrolase family protein n=1 Tax=Flavobacterium aquidurense TaxID=362413 RepID=UPI0037166D62
MSKALIVIDIQNDYFENGAMELTGSLEASEKAKLMIENFRSENLPVIHVQHLSVAPDAFFFLPETEGVKIHNNVEPLVGEKVITKYYPNSFRDTDLLEHLESLKITELVFVGMMTQMCVDATVRAAKDFGFECTVIGDACATRDLEVNNRSVSAADVQTSFLAGLSFFYADIKDTADYLSA